MTRQIDTGELISKQALLYALDDIELTDDGGVDINDLEDLIKRMPIIEAEPTIKQIEDYCRKRCLVVVDGALFNEMKSRWSAEPIVRCKDCRYNYANMIPGGKGCQQNVYVETADDWYCADGARMDEVEE